jgi:hypothetical protein
MEASKRVLVLSTCILLSSILFCFLANIQAGEPSDTEISSEYDVYQEDVVVGEDEGANAWVEEEEYKEDYEEEYREGTQENFEYENAPSDPQEEPSTEWPSDDEDFPENPRDDDDLASL